jgi:methylthioribose-1-phosphate isomerase
MRTWRSTRRSAATASRSSRQIAARKSPGETINILTHCNAGWLATVDWGTATAPIYTAHDAGLPVHVWVDETRPRNQGASLTAWELLHHGVPHTVIPDNTGGHLMQHGMVDMAIVGTDRTTAQGDVCNKIGTYLKALAAHDNGVPFYVALPSPTIDFTVVDGVKEIPIEQRGGHEVSHMTGRTGDGRIETVEIVPKGSKVANFAFDVTPARYVTGLITERGVIAANREAIAAAFPERENFFSRFSGRRTRCGTQRGDEGGVDTHGPLTYPNCVGAPSSPALRERTSVALHLLPDRRAASVTARIEG